MAIAKVASVYGGSTDGNAFTTSAIDTTGATSIVVVIVDGAGSAASGVADSASNTWGSPVIGPLTVGSVRLQAWICAGPTTSATHTFSATGGAIYGPTLSAIAFSGTLTASVLDQYDSDTVTGASTIQPGSITPTEDNEMLVTAVGSNDGITVVDAPFSPADGYVSPSGQHQGAALAISLQTTATARNPTWNWGFAANGAAMILSLKEAATGQFARTVFNAFQTFGPQTVRHITIQ